MTHKIIIAGAGPGAEDLITMRALEAVKKADLIVYAGSLVNPEILNYAKSNCKKLNSAGMSFEEVIKAMTEAWHKGLQVLRLHSGDPSLYGAISEQMNALNEQNIEFEIIPGVSCAFAAAAALKFEFTMPGITQTTILTRRAGRTPVPDKEHLKFLAANNASIVLYLSIADIDGAVQDFLQAGRSEETPAAVVYRASWNNEQIIRGTLKDISKKVKDAGIKRQALIIVGEALSKSGDKSLLYASHFQHGYRKDKKNRFTGKTAVYAITKQGCHKAVELEEGLTDAKLFLPERFCDLFHNASFFEKNTLSTIIEENWEKFDAHIFIMASGIVIRKINKLIKNKLTDPAVVVCDERGNYIVSLLSGHIGGANRLASDIAGITGGQAVITTATDVNKIIAFDEMATLNNYLIINPESIKNFNSMLLEKKHIDVLIPENVFSEYYKNLENLNIIKNIKEIGKNPTVILDTFNENLKQPIQTMKLSSKIYTLGIGCRKNTSYLDIEKAVTETLKLNNISISNVALIASTIEKNKEQGLLEFAEKQNLPCVFLKNNTLNAIDVPNPSKHAKETFGLNSVAEAAALVLASNIKYIFNECIPLFPEKKTFTPEFQQLKNQKITKLIIEKTKSDKVTVAIAQITY
jgi:precorrin-4 C11-methyltransferase